MLFSLSLLGDFYWTLGNFEGFLEATQLLILGLLRYLGLGMVLASLGGLAGSLLLAPGRPWSKRLSAAAAYLFLGLFGAGHYLFGASLALLSKGL